MLTKKFSRATKWKLFFADILWLRNWINASQTTPNQVCTPLPQYLQCLNHWYSINQRCVTNELGCRRYTKASHKRIANTFTIERDQAPSQFNYTPPSIK